MQLGHWMDCLRINRLKAWRQLRRKPPRKPSFDALEERCVLAAYVLPDLTPARPTVDMIGAITNTNPNNIYHVDLAANSVVQGNLSGLAANLDFIMKNAAGTEVAASRKSGVAIESFTTAQLPSGHYTLQVVRVGSAQSRYRLTLSIAGGDDLLTGATELGTVAKPTPVQFAAGALTGGRDNQDYFRFQATLNSPIRLALSGLTSDVNLQVLDRNGVLITQGNASQSALEDVAFTPALTGDYFLRVWLNVSTGSNYRLDISVNLPGDDLFVTPISIGTLSSDRPTEFREGQLGKFDSPDFDTQDYYRFAVASPSPVRINMRGYAMILSDIEVLDQLGRPIAFQRSFDNRIFNLYHPSLSTGRYIIRVVQEQHSGTPFDFVTYVLVVGTDTSSNDFPSNPTNLGTFSSPTLRTVRLVDSVGDGADKMDHYRFSLLAPTQFSFSATVQRSDANITIYQLGAEGIATGASTIYLRMTTTSDPISLPAGNYIVWIRPTYRNVPSSYILTMSADASTDDVQGRGKNVGTLMPEQRPTVVASDSVGGLDIQDFYRFNILNPSHAFVTLGNMTSNLGIAVLDRWGRSRGTRSNSPGTGLETIALNNLAVDTYYVRIYPEPGEQPSNYELMISLSGGDDLISGAVPLGVLDATTRSSVSFSSTVGGATDVQDYYRVVLATDLTLHIDLTGQTSVFQIQVLTVDGHLITEARTAPTAGELSVALPADEYVLRVTSLYALRSYQFSARR